MPAERVIFRLYAVQRMFFRGISREEVRQVLESGDVIETYAEDVPYPSKLLLGWSGRRPIHVVAAENIAGRTTIVITVYEPDPRRWDQGLRRRV